MKKTLFALIAIYFLLSCTSIAKVLYGIKKPKIENKESIIKYLKKKKMDFNNVLTVDKQFYEKTANKTGIPDILIFDNKNKKLIKYKEETSCNASAFTYLEKLSPTTILDYDKDENLDSFLLKLRDLNCNKIPFEISKSDDFTLFIFWSKFIGKLNKDHVKIWEELASENKNVKIKTYKVNLDLQECWE